MLKMFLEGIELDGRTIELNSAKNINNSSSSSSSSGRRQGNSSSGLLGLILGNNSSSSNSNSSSSSSTSSSSSGSGSGGLYNGMFLLAARKVVKSRGHNYHIWNVEDERMWDDRNYQGKLRDV